MKNYKHFLYYTVIQILYVILVQQIYYVVYGQFIFSIIVILLTVFLEPFLYMFIINFLVLYTVIYSIFVYTSIFSLKRCYVEKYMILVTIVCNAVRYWYNEVDNHPVIVDVDLN